MTRIWQPCRPLASDILLMERGQSKAVTGKEHLERNDFIIEKQKAELQRIEETKRHKEQQVSLAEQELKQVKAEIRTDKLKSAATDAATAITSGVGSLFGSGKLKDLEQANESLRHEIAKRDKGIDELKSSRCNKCRNSTASRFVIFKEYIIKSLKPKTRKYHD